jgi:hypothetical protein
MASTALLKADLVALSKSWVLRGWLIALALAEFFGLTIALAQNRQTPIPASLILATNLILYLYIWSNFIIVLSAGSVSLESDIISDSVLSRACTRTQYIAAKIAARALVILGIYLVFAGIAGFTAWRYAASDMTLLTMLTGIGIVGMAVLLLVSLGVMMSVVFNNTIISVIGLLLLWYVASPVFGAVGADYLSPDSLRRNLPLILKDPSAPQVVQAGATATSITVVFSKNVDARKAETTENYAIECPPGTMLTAQTAVYDKSRTSVILSGLSLPPGETAKVTVRGVTDTGGSEISPAADSATATVPATELTPNASAPRTIKPSGTPTPNAQRPAPIVRRAPDRFPPRVTQCSATASSLKVTFSKELDPKDAENVAHYVIESPPGRMHTAKAATYTAGTRSVLLSGLSFAPDDPVKVTVKDVKDLSGNPIGTSGNSALYTEVTTWKYVLGFGLPAIAAALLGIVWFSRRDL